MVKDKNKLEEEFEDELSLEDDDLEEKKTKKKIKFDDLDDSDVDDYKDISLEDRVEGIEKKLTIVMILVVVTLLFSAVNTIVFISGGDTFVESNKTTQTASYDTSAFKEIKASDIEEESKNETIIVWIGHQGCGFCQQYAPVISSISKQYGVTVRYIDLAKIVNFEVEQPYITDTAAWETLNALTGSGEWATFVPENLGGTPLTFVVNKNKVVGGLVGSETEEKIEKVFTDAGFSK